MSNDISRRGFLQTSAAASMLAASASALAAGNVQGANDKLRIGFIGVGGRCQAHIDHVLALTPTHDVQAVAVCDVFNRHREESAAKIDKQNASNGIATKCKIFPDYRAMLDDKDIDVVCIATPDHWHAKQIIDSVDAGKDVYCEKPMTHTIEEGYAVVEAVRRNKKVMQVGVQCTSEPTLDHAYNQIINGRIGKVVQAQTSYYRNSSIGMSRYYKLTEDMTPTNVDWDAFLGHKYGLAPKVPFDRARYFQWRCYWDYGGGMITDLFVHRITRMMKSMGVREPRRVVGAGGLYLELDGREVPDVATLVSDFDEGCQLLVTSAMTNNTGIDDIIRGHTATLAFTDYGYDIREQKLANRPTGGFEKIAAKDNEEVRVEGKIKGDETRKHWENFISCVRSRNPETNCPPELGAAAITLVNMGMISYREGRTLFFDKQSKKVVNADASWAKGWEKLSAEHGKPTQVIGWKAGDTGSTIQAPEHQRLEGPWINGVDPARKGDISAKG